MFLSQPFLWENFLFCIFPVTLMRNIFFNNILIFQKYTGSGCFQSRALGSSSRGWLWSGAGLKAEEPKGRWRLGLLHWLACCLYTRLFFGLLYTLGMSSKNITFETETRVLSLGQEDPLKEEMAAHFSILAWKIPWMEEPGGLQSIGSQRIEHDQACTHKPVFYQKRQW